MPRALAPGSLLAILAISVGACLSLPRVADAQEPEAQRSVIPDEYGVALQPWSGDYDGMLQRRMIRVVVPYSMTHFFLDGATERGIAASMGRELEREINRTEGLSSRLVHVVFIPAPRSQLVSYVTAGLADIAMGNLAITESRREVVDFTIPFIRNSEVLVVTGPDVPDIETIEGLAGREVYAPASYHESLDALSRTLQARGLEPIRIEPADEWLEPDEVLELVNAGVVPITVADRHLAEFWGQVFSGLTVRSDLVVATGRDLGWAIRKDSPRLMQVLNDFLTENRQRTLFGNIVLRRYLQNTTWVRNFAASADRARYEATIPLFGKYGDIYDLGPLFLAALGYQESRLDQSVVSPAGAIGVMQLLPATGASLDVGDITQLEPNIHAGTRYVRRLIDNSIRSPDVDRLNTMLLALASYNAGQTRIRRLRRETEQAGLDPNVWFDNVEFAVAREIGRETVQYVSNVYKYYLAFRRIEEQRARRAER